MKCYHDVWSYRGRTYPTLYDALMALAQSGALGKLREEAGAHENHVETR